jgi:nicotinate-nucleotide adenylyltransferase
MALEAQHQLGLDHVAFLPTPSPGHKVIDGAQYIDRRAMLERAIAPHTKFSIQTIEERLPPPHYTVRTLNALRQVYADQEIHLCWIMGSDSLQALDHWHDWLKLFDLTHFIIIDRPRQPPLSPSLNSALANRWISSAEALRATATGKLLSVASPALDVSSTAIRQKARLGEPLDYLMPQTVIDYITQNRLYLR